MATDNFNRADSADLGASWDVMTGETAMKILGNACYPSSVTSDATESYNAVAFANDQYSQVLVASIGADGIGAGVGIGLRMATGARTYYRVVACLSGSEIAKQVAGTYTQLGTNATAWVIGDTLYVSVSGTTIQVKRNGSNLFSATDSAIASGRAGVSHSSNTTADSKVDDWDGGDLAAAVTRVPPTVVVSQAVHRTASW